MEVRLIFSITNYKPSNIPMKNIFLFIAILFIVNGCIRSKGPGENQVDITKEKKDSVVNVIQPIAWTHPGELMTIPIAEKILGGPVAIMDTITTFESDVLTYKSNHAALELDASGQLSNLYFMHEDFPTEAGAMRIYKSLMNSEQSKPGFAQIMGMGDEAYFHEFAGDNCFIMSRKGKQMIRMKVNKVTPATSVTDFKLIANSIIEQL